MSSAPQTRDASKTAMGVALVRAAHQLLDQQPLILDDPVTPRLLPPDMLSDLKKRPAWVDDPWTRTMRGHLVARSRFAEDRLQAAAKRGVEQFVILGAGIDTFAYRQPAWAKTLRIFEVDHGASQAEKCERLSAAGVAIPGNLDYVAIDFEKVSLRDGLKASRLDFGKSTFFSCLGVLVYLTMDAAQAVFQLVSSFPKSSEIAFSFSVPGDIDTLPAQQAKAMGEPWLTFFEPEKLGQDLMRLGFAPLSVMQPDDVDQRYFANRGDSLKAGLHERLAAAIVD